jgi:hypothetical protein
MGKLDISFFTASVTVVLSCGSAMAQNVSDPQTGLAVTPPPGYEAKAASARGRYTAVIEVKRTQDRDTGCKIAFQPARQNRGLSQAQINKLVDMPERRRVIESSLGAIYQVDAVDQFDHDGVRGSAATATLKPTPGLPARATEMINLFYLMETPEGRTTVVCVSDKQSFGVRRSEFNGVVRSIKLPR